MSGPDGLAVTADGKALFVGNGDSTVVVFDLTTMHLGTDHPRHRPFLPLSLRASRPTTTGRKEFRDVSLPGTAKLARRPIVAMTAPTKWPLTQRTRPCCHQRRPGTAIHYVHRHGVYVGASPARTSAGDPLGEADLTAYRSIRLWLMGRILLDSVPHLMQRPAPLALIPTLAWDPGFFYPLQATGTGS